MSRITGRVKWFQSDGFKCRALPFGAFRNRRAYRNTPLALRNTGRRGLALIADDLATRYTAT